MNETSKPPVSVVILNFNGLHFLKICLPLVLATDYPNLDLLVVDNGSTDGSLEYVDSFGGLIRLLSLGYNQGFTGANNEAIRDTLARGAKYIICLNNDTRVEPGWVTALVDVMEEDSRIGIAGSKIKTWDGSLVEYAGEYFDPVLAAGGYTDEVDGERFSRVHDAAYACGAAICLRADMVREIGAFDPGFFIYNEDVELSLRAWRYGYRVVFVPGSVIYHHRSPTAKNEAQKRARGMQNALSTIIKLVDLKTIVRHARTLVGAFWIHADRPVRRATLANLPRLPRLLRERFRIRRHQVYSYREIIDLVPHIHSPRPYHQDLVQCQSTHPGGELMTGDRIRQQFTSRLPNLARIDIFPATFAREAEGVWDILLLDSGGVSQMSRCIDVSTLQDNTWYSICFPPIAESENHCYSLEILVRTGVTGSAAGLWSSHRRGFGCGCLERNGIRQRGSLTFRVFSLFPDDIDLVPRLDLRAAHQEDTEL